MHFTIDGPPRTKKTSNRVVHKGRRCGRCKRGDGPPIVLPSEAFVEWEIEAAPQLRRQWAAVETRKVACSRCKGTGEKTSDPRDACIGCGGTGARPAPVASIVVVTATFYREADVGDLAGYVQALGDALQTAGVLKNDELIKSWPGFPLDKDAARPRVELDITSPNGDPDLRRLVHDPRQLGLGLGAP
jgi:hypothetical protein